jgi:hypothetical protein
MQHSIDLVPSPVAEDAAPRFGVYLVIPRPGRDDESLTLGVAVPHLDGKGFDLLMPSLQLDGKLELREVAGSSERRSAPQPLAQQVQAFERAAIEQCLAECGGRISAVMQRLDIPRRTLSEKMARLGIDRRRYVRRSAELMAKNPEAADSPLR